MTISKRFKQRGKKFALTMLLVLFGLQQTAVGVFAAPIPTEPTTYGSEVINPMIQTEGEALQFYFTQQMNDGGAVDFYKMDTQLTPVQAPLIIDVDKDGIFTPGVDTTTLENAIERISFDAENQIYLFDTSGLASEAYFLLFYPNETNGGFLLLNFVLSIDNGQENPSPSVTGGSISVFSGETQITTNDTEIEAGSTLTVNVMLQFDGAPASASDLSGDLGLHFVSSINNTNDLGVPFSKVNAEENDGIYQITIPVDTSPGDYLIRLSQAGGLENGSYAEQGFKVIAQPAITLENVLFGSNSPITLSANSPVALNIRAYYSDAPNTATSLKNNNEVKFQLTDAQGIIIGDQSILQISFIDNSKLLASITTSGEYRVNLFITDNATIFDTLPVQILNSIEDSTVEIDTPIVNQNEPLLFTTLIKLSNGEALSAQTLENIYPQVYKKIGETYELVIDTTAALEEPGQYGTSMDADLNGNTLEAGTYAVALHTYAQDGTLQTLTGTDQITYFEFELVDAVPENPEAVFTASTGDANSNGYLDKITVTFSNWVIFDTIQLTDFSVDGYTLTGIQPVDMVAAVEGVEGENLVKSINLLITQSAENKVYDTGATPDVTLSADLGGITSPKTVTPTDKANPIIVQQTGNSGVGTEYTSMTLTFSEPVDQSGPSDSFQFACPLTEGNSLSSCVYANITAEQFGPGIHTTNTYSLTYSTSSLDLILADSSVYPVTGLYGTPLILVTQHGLVQDLAKNLLQANATIEHVSLEVTAVDTTGASVSTTALQASDIVTVKTNVTYFGSEESVLADLPNAGYPLLVADQKQQGIFSKKNTGTYTFTITDSHQITEDKTFQVLLNDPRLPIVELKTVTVMKKEAPVDNGGSGSNGGNSGGGSGGGGAPIINHPPKAVLKLTTPSPFVVGEKITVDGSGSTDPDNNAIFYSWNFGDNTVTELSTLDALMNHQYAMPGAYLITLKIQDSNQATDTTSTLVNVVAIPEDEIPQTSTTTPETSPTSTATSTVPTAPTTPIFTPTIPTDSFIPNQLETTEIVENTTDEIDEQITQNPTTNSVKIAEANQEEDPIPAWLKWLFGSSVAVAAVWTGILANRYRKYVA